MINLTDLLLPDWYIILNLFIFGLIIGSFLNVFIYRLHTGKSLAGSSHCMSCGTRLRWYELVPLFSFLALRGRCRTCDSKITPRYFLVELVTGFLFAGTFLITTDVIALSLWLVVMSVLVVVTVYDLQHFIIPDSLTIALTALAISLIAYRYFLVQTDLLDLLLTTFLFPLLASAFLFLLWFISKGTWLGFGDVKLIFPLGLLVGPASVFSLVVLSFWVGAVISLIIIAYNKYGRGKEHLHLISQQLTMKSEVPFAPFLVVSCLIILFTGFNVLELFTFI
jgi:leader peptidase (prepilin peptidase)/N-methyltransferase